jgi:hypothetical protein
MIPNDSHQLMAQRAVVLTVLSYCKQPLPRGLIATNILRGPPAAIDVS